MAGIAMVCSAVMAVAVVNMVSTGGRTVAVGNAAQACFAAGACAGEGGRRQQSASSRM